MIWCIVQFIVNRAVWWLYVTMFTTIQSITVQCSTVYSTVQCRYGAVQCSTVYSTVQCSAVYSTVQCSIQYSAVQYTVQCSSVYSTVQCSATSSSDFDIPKMKMDISKNGKWIVAFKKFSRVRVKLKYFTWASLGILGISPPEQLVTCHIIFNSHIILKLSM